MLAIFLTRDVQYIPQFQNIGRAAEDYAVLLFGSSIFKILRLLMIALLFVHFFACAFFRVKKESANSPDDVASFFTSKNVDPTVRSPWRCVQDRQYSGKKRTNGIVLAGPATSICEDQNPSLMSVETYRSPGYMRKPSSVMIPLNDSPLPANYDSTLISTCC